jgi:uncharacterized SAM-binding protein YcdF (DUF218 family)
MSLLDRPAPLESARKLWHILRSLLLTLGVVLVLITFTPVLRWWTAGLMGPWGDGKGKILIVLGGDLTTPEILGVTSYWRSVYAVFAWRGGGYQTLVLSGHNLAGPMRDFVTAYGIPRESILIEDRSSDTHENALFTTALLRNDPREKVLLTSDYHMLRAFRAFRKAGLNVSPLPYPDAQKRVGNRIERWSIFCLLATETTRIVYYRLRGWI